MKLLFYVNKINSLVLVIELLVLVKFCLNFTDIFHLQQLDVFVTKCTVECLSYSERKLLFVPYSFFCFYVQTVLKCLFLQIH